MVSFVKCGGDGIDLGMIWISEGILHFPLSPLLLLLSVDESDRLV